MTKSGMKLSVRTQKFFLARIRTLELEVKAANNSLSNQEYHKKRCEYLEKKVKTLEFNEQQRLRNCALGIPYDLDGIDTLQSVRFRMGVKRKMKSYENLGNELKRQLEERIRKLENEAEQAYVMRQELEDKKRKEFEEKTQNDIFALNKLNSKVERLNHELDI